MRPLTIILLSTNIIIKYLYFMYIIFSERERERREIHGGYINSSYLIKKMRMVRKIA